MEGSMDSEENYGLIPRSVKMIFDTLKQYENE